MILAIPVVVAAFIIVAVLMANKAIKSPPIKSPPSVSASPDFTIEFYPESGYYFPKCNGQYLSKTDPWTGLIELKDKYYYAEHFKHEAWAMEHAKKFQEQRFRVGVVEKSVSLEEKR